MKSMDLADIRREYQRIGLHLSQLCSSPLAQLRSWLDEAMETGLPDPTAMILSTVSSFGEPSQRTVLLKELEHQGIVFYTNYGSRKAVHITANKQVSLLFPWHPIDRQVIVSGHAQILAATASAHYFHNRPRESQLSAWASSQSAPIPSRWLLLAKLEEMRCRFKGGHVPPPGFWGGYLVKPYRFEFWQGRENRLHDRFEYRRDPADTWRIIRLAP